MDLHGTFLSEVNYEMDHLRHNSLCSAAKMDCVGVLQQSLFTKPLSDSVRLFDMICK